MSNTYLGFPPATMAVFLALTVAAIAIDLLSHRKDAPITLCNAALWPVFWLRVSLAFAGYLYVAHGAEVASLALAGKGALFATPLFLCLVMVEVSDVLFAFDSVPVVIAVSREPLIVYSAMLFAILGLRTLYFVLEALKRYLVHLEKAVVALLFFIAAKLALNATDHFLGHGYTIDPNVSLVVVLVVLAIGMAASLLFPAKPDHDTAVEADAGA